MNGGDEDSVDSVAGAPIDFDRLEIIQERLAADRRFDRVEPQRPFASEQVECVYDQRFYPARVRGARLDIVWFENGDFSLHYHEDHETGAFDHLWDRHPSPHNTRDHVHPGPDAPTPGTDASHPADWRDVLSMVLAAIDDRQRGFWKR